MLQSAPHVYLKTKGSFNHHQENSVPIEPYLMGPQSTLAGACKDRPILANTMTQKLRRTNMVTRASEIIDKLKL